MKHIKTLLFVLAFALVMPISQAAVDNKPVYRTSKPVDTTVIIEVQPQPGIVLSKPGHVYVPETIDPDQPYVQYDYPPQGQVIRDVQQDISIANTLSNFGTYFSLVFFILGLLSGSFLVALLGFLLPWAFGYRSNKYWEKAMDRAIDSKNKEIKDKNEKIEYLEKQLAMMQRDYELKERGCDNWENEDKDSEIERRIMQLEKDLNQMKYVVGLKEDSNT